MNKLEYKYTVCAVVVTYNRKELLKRNLDSLLIQTYPLDILIYDNASTDGTYQYLLDFGYLNNEHINFVKGDKNLGGAGGFSNGEKIAFQKGYDLLWLMDDDGYCINERTLEECIKVYNPNQKNIINSYVLCDPKTKELTFDLGPYKTNDEVENASKDGVVSGYGNPYNGTLVPKKCFEDIGFTDERFFIYGDENDFFLRTTKSGYVWITSISSLYYHPINRKIKEYSFLGVSYNSKEQPIWKFFIEYRNAIYLRLNYGRHQRFLYIILIRILMVLSALHSSNKKIKRIKWGWIGINDGINGYFDRPIPFKE